jgi:hypothetical protein
VARFDVRLSEQFAQVLKALERTKPPSKRAIREMIAKVQKVKLKPEKGRLKDLQSLELLADQLAELLAKD